MTINISLPEGHPNLRPRITVIGVGGAGGNAVNNMINSNLEGVDFLVANTDSQALENSLCEKRVQLGLNITKGLGAGMRPEIGKSAAEEASKDIETKLSGSNMAFIAAGMGGGTGTGAAPVIAKIARENGVLTVGVITKPFHFEGIQRMRLADEGIAELEQSVDTLLIIPNQNLFRIANEKTTFSNAFKMADDVLYAGVRGVTDLMVMPGLINLDFSDIRTVMSEMGKAMMGTGEAQGENRAVAAAEAAIANPLIDDVSLKGAKGLIINITGGKDLTLYEVDEAANRIREEVDVDANIIFGSTTDDRLEGIMRVSIVATGIEANGQANHNFGEKQVLKIDNTVYQKPLLHNKENVAISPSITSKGPNMENSSLNTVNESNENLENHESLTRHDTLTVNEQYTHNNTNESEKLYQTQTESIDKNDENLEINEEPSVDKSNEENTNVRRLSLFDNIEKSNPSSDKDGVEKKEPYLSYTKDEQEESEESGSINQELNTTEEKSTEEEFVQENQEQNNSEDNLNQEEELLDIPTFLRRQAN